MSLILHRAFLKPAWLTTRYDIKPELAVIKVRFTTSVWLMIDESQNLQLTLAALTDFRSWLHGPCFISSIKAPNLVLSLGHETRRGPEPSFTIMTDLGNMTQVSLLPIIPFMKLGEGQLIWLLRNHRHEAQVSYLWIVILASMKAWVDLFLVSVYELWIAQENGTRFTIKASLQPRLRFLQGLCDQHADQASAPPRFLRISLNWLISHFA
ncbi:hypothetical protein VNO77_14533 [Canavalia gladiata]|uniref:Uncharacterized protein n=1 Tax=Canavalia gladiata TaxID=3824 RepID=A0AAN9LYS3_CANGL